MTKQRKDNKGRILKKGESQRSSDLMYVYTYNIFLSRKKEDIYMQHDLVKLREKEKKLSKAQLDGLDSYVAGHADLNFAFDRYISTKTDLRSTTYSNYVYMHDHFVRKGFGQLN